MTVQEYEQLVRSSASFKEMDLATQMNILSARGESMENYIKIFQEEHDLMKAAAEDFYNKSEQVVLDFKTDVKNAKNNKLKKAENQVKANEEKDLDKLLKSI